MTNQNRSELAAQRGRRDFEVFAGSPLLRSYFGTPNRAQARDVMRFFWPLMEQPALQMTTPLPPEREAWLRGFEAARLEWLTDAGRGRDEQVLRDENDD